MFVFAASKDPLDSAYGSLFDSLRLHVQALAGFQLFDWFAARPWGTPSLPII